MPWHHREVAKAVRLRKACTVVVAPNIEQIESEGGLDDLLSSILTQAEDANIPIVFALSRKKLGQVRPTPWKLFFEWYYDKPCVSVRLHDAQARWK